MTDIISDVLGFLDTKRKDIKPEYTRNGKPVYTIRKYAELTDLDAEILINGGSQNLAQKVPTIGVNGNLLRTPRTSYAVNVEIAFDNRLKIDEIVNEDGTKENVYIFVVDQRALMEQKSGRIYTNNVVGFIIGKGAKGKAEVKGVTHVPEKEFLNDYTNTLDPYEMEEVMELINRYRVTNGTKKVVKTLKF